MSTIKLENIQTRTGSGTITIGASGETVEVASGVTTNLKNGATLSDNILFDTASKGIYLGVTSATASNLLDDYEEGTWTPTIIVDGVARTSILVNKNKYVKVGRLVTISCMIRASGGTTTGAVTIGGTLPFTPDHGFIIKPSNRALDFDNNEHLKINENDTTIYTRTSYDQDTTDTNNEVTTADTRSIKVLEFSAIYHTTA